MAIPLGKPSDKADHPESHRRNRVGLNQRFLSFVKCDRLSAVT